MIKFNCAKGKKFRQGSVQHTSKSVVLIARPDIDYSIEGFSNLIDEKNHARKNKKLSVVRALILLMCGVGLLFVEIIKSEKRQLEKDLNLIRSLPSWQMLEQTNTEESSELQFISGADDQDSFVKQSSEEGLSLNRLALKGEQGVTDGKVGYRRIQIHKTSSSAKRIEINKKIRDAILTSDSMDFSLAEELFLDLIRLGVVNDALYLAMGKLYSDNKIWNKASRSLEKVCQYGNSDVNCYYNLAVSYDHLGERNKARRFYYKALKGNQAIQRRFDNLQVLDRLNSL